MRASLFVAALFASVAASAVTTEAIPDPRPAHHVVDLTSTLSAEDISEIDASAQSSAARGELFVAVVDSVGGEVPRAFATRLFNRLRLDPTSRNTGVLVLVALNDHKAEIVVGDGFTGVTGITDDIMSGTIVANMKAGSPRTAITGAAAAIAHRVYVDRSAAEGVVGAVEDVVDPSSPVTWGGGLALLVGGGAGTRSILRRRRRTCAKCSTKMTRLDEQADDKHLNEGERLEERLGSVDHDVWFCGRCGHTQKIGWRAIFTPYSRCSSCNVRAHKTTTTTTVSPTEYSEGSAHVVEHCEACGRGRSYTKTLARVTPSTTSSSSSGGGHSSGGGSSGSW